MSNNEHPLTDVNAQEQPLTFDEQFALNRARWNIETAKRFGIPLWMLTGFPALSNEPDDDDDILE